MTGQASVSPGTLDVEMRGYDTMILRAHKEEVTLMEELDYGEGKTRDEEAYDSMAMLVVAMLAGTIILAVIVGLSIWLT